MKRFLLFNTLILLIFYTTCKKNPTQPPPRDKDPRQYTWTVDTLAYPGSYQTLMSRIWGSSAKDVYVVGHNDQNRGMMYHYDGNEWKDVQLAASQGGLIHGAIGLSAVFGFSANDVWAVGDRSVRIGWDSLGYGIDRDESLIIHYDGTTWTESPTPDGNTLQSVWGSSPDDIWAGGVNGTLLHYNGNHWTPDSVPVDIPADADPFYNFTSITGSENDTYLLLQMQFRYQKLFMRADTTWSTIESPMSSIYEFWLSPEGTLFAWGSGIVKYNGSNWQKILDKVTIRGLHGISESDVFAVGSSEWITRVYHYNGGDWHLYDDLRYENVSLYEVWTDGNEVFIVGQLLDETPQKTVILHGV